MCAQPMEIEPAEACEASVVVREVREYAEVLHIFGDVDLSNADQLSDAIASASSGSLPVVVDFKCATYVDSTTLSRLIVARDALPGRFYIVHPPAGHVRRIFEITSLLGKLPIVESAEALNTAGG